MVRILTAGGWGNMDPSRPEIAMHEGAFPYNHFVNSPINGGFVEPKSHALIRLTHLSGTVPAGQMQLKLAGAILGSVTFLSQAAVEENFAEMGIGNEWRCLLDLESGTYRASGGMFQLVATDYSRPTMVPIMRPFCQDSSSLLLKVWADRVALLTDTMESAIIPTPSDIETWIKDYQAQVSLNHRSSPWQDGLLYYCLIGNTPERPIYWHTFRTPHAWIKHPTSLPTRETSVANSVDVSP